MRCFQCKCLSQVRINWEGCSRKVENEVWYGDVRDKNVVTVECTVDEVVWAIKGPRTLCSNHTNQWLCCCCPARYSLMFCIQPLIDQSRRPQQSGFTARRSSTDAILALRLLSELHREFNQPLNVAFLDIKSAFDSFSHTDVRKALRSKECLTSYSICSLFFMKTQMRVSGLDRNCRQEFPPPLVSGLHLSSHPILCCHWLDDDPIVWMRWYPGRLSVRLPVLSFPAP